MNTLNINNTCNNISNDVVPSNFPAIYFIARNEIRNVVGHPLVIVISAILLALSILNGVGLAHILPLYENGMMPEPLMGKDIFLIMGMGNISGDFSLYITILAIFIGALSIGEERSNRSLSVLLTKPLYKRDVVVGKFLGNGVFLVFFIFFNIITSSLLVMVFFREPFNILDFVIRIFSFILLLCLECMLSLGITMLAGILFKNIFVALTVAITFYYIDWYSYLTSYLGSLAVLIPSYLYFKIININEVNLLDTSIGYMKWLNFALPFILFMVLELVAIMLIDCFVFARGE